MRRLARLYRTPLKCTWSFQILSEGHSRSMLNYGRCVMIIGGFVVASAGAILAASANDFRFVIVGSAFVSGVLSNQGFCDSV